jgi:hypothetical protein
MWYSPRRQPPAAGPIRIVIDPLMDGMTGYQSKATQSIQDQDRR